MMTERKWTHGPWVWVDGDLEDRGGEPVAYHSCHGGVVVNDANAHLIAAAPDLYEALELMRHEYRTALRISGVDEMTSKTMATANAALAKARGEA